jgi:PadR family transcriptional regulator PadR
MNKQPLSEEAPDILAESVVFLLTSAINYYNLVIDGNHLLVLFVSIHERIGMKVLTRTEEIILLSILRLKDNAFSLTILKEIKHRTGKNLTIGSLWVFLDSLHKKGYIDKGMAEETPAKGGRKKVYYSLTPSGAKALRNAKELQKSLWKGLDRKLKKIEI